MKIAVVSLAGCEGCLYNIINEQLFKLLDKYNAELVDWRLLGVKKSDEYDIAIIEGSIVSEKDLKRVQFIREKSKIIIAVGACAIHGGVQAGLYDENKKQRSKPLAYYVKVDYHVRGCPVEVEEFLELLESILKGEKPVRYERRFDLVERQVIRVSDSEGFLMMDSSKCIVCGRCIEVCRIMKASVLNYINRGISTLISTPYHEQFNNVGCHYCGLCVAYCPVGAITYRLEPERLTRGDIVNVYIEPEALASLAEAEGVDPLRILNALYVLGYSNITIYSNDSRVQPGRIYAKSLVEYQFLRRTYPNLDVELLAPKIPSNAIYITQCVAWRKVLKNAVTSRELQTLLKSIPKDTLTIEPFDQLTISLVVNSDPSIKYVHTLHELEELMEKQPGCALIYTMCPGGCLMGGGQPLSRGNSWYSIYEERKKILHRIMNAQDPFKQQ
ncbi:MAG: 4Fe-4S binding protein [Desulfurococcaceae archaeon]